MKAVQDLHLVIRVVLSALVFLVGFGLSVAAWDKIQLPFSNPWGIVGTLANAGINPTNDLLRFILAVLAAPSLLFLLSVVPSVRRQLLPDQIATHSRKSFPALELTNRALPRNLIVIAAVGLAIVTAVNVPTYHSWGAFDSFHEGESLGTSVSLTGGSAPYRDVVFVHGVIQDPMRSQIAFSLYGRSIGAARALESATKITSCVLLFFVLLKLLKSWQCALLGFLVFSFLSLPAPHQSLKMIGAGSVIIPPRDVTTFSFLLVFLSICQRFDNRAAAELSTYLLGSCLGFLAVFSFGYSIDRGFYIAAAFLVTLPFLLALPSAGRQKFIMFMYIAFGTTLGFAGLGVILQGQYRSFFEFAFLLIPKYKELMDGKVFAIFSPRCFLVVAAVAAAAFIIVRRVLVAFFSLEGSLLTRMFTSVRVNVVEVMLLVLAVFFFRSALGRSDWEHVSYSLSPLILLILRLFASNLSALNGTKTKRLRDLSSIGLLLVVGFVGILGVWTSFYHDNWRKNFPLHIPDSEFIPAGYSNAIDFLKDHLGPEDDFLTLTSEASWYYFLNKPSPIRFPVIWFSAPTFLQQETAVEIERSNVKFVIYENEHWANRIDGLSMRERMPLLFKKIEAKFEPCRIIDGNDIWVHRDFNESELCAQ